MAESNSPLSVLDGIQLIMINEFDTAAIEQIYTLICQNERILKRDLVKSVGGISNYLLDDILFHLKLKRGIFIKRNAGIFKDYATYQKLK